MSINKILITGAGGQLGTVLTKKLQEKFGLENVVYTDIRKGETNEGIFEILDVTDADKVNSIVEKYKITQIYHLAAILSANGEKFPLKTWAINTKAFFNVLEAAKKYTIEKVFFPSSIAVFGDNVDKVKTPQSSNLTPTTSYGISKAAGENWAFYYHKKYGLDIRSLRYPGVIGHQSLPGGGTTDYAIDIFHKAIKNEKFECFLNAESTLPMIYMDDAIRATLELMDAPKEKITVRTSYNIAGASFNPKELSEAIKKFYPDFEIIYKPDFRQEIANSWPKSICDNDAQNDWNWKPEFNLEKITSDMINNLS